MADFSCRTSLRERDDRRAAENPINLPQTVGVFGKRLLGKAKFNLSEDQELRRGVGDGRGSANMCGHTKRPFPARTHMS